MDISTERRLEAAEAFAVNGQVKSCEPYGSGHICWCARRTDRSTPIFCSR